MNDAIDCAIMDIGLPDFKNISNILLGQYP
jgi:hypothetical protein